MKTIILKNTVQVRGMTPELLFGIMVLHAMWPEGEALVVTSIADSAHRETSLHYAGCAADFRSKNLADTIKGQLREMVDAALGVDYDFLLEDQGEDNEHFHLEYQPRGRP